MKRQPLVCSIASLLLSSGFVLGCGSSQTKPKKAQLAPVQPIANHEVGFAGYLFDPLNYRNVLPTRLLRDPEYCAQRPCDYIVQLSRDTDGAIQDELTSKFGLALSQYVPKRAYLERLEPDVRDALCGHATVRACMPHQPALVIPRQDTDEFRRLQSAITDRDPQLSRLVGVLFSSADIATIRAQLTALGVQVVRVTDNRNLGGKPSVSFHVPALATLEKVAFINGFQYIEVAGRVGIDDR